MNSRNHEYQNSAGFTDKSAIFSENLRGNFWANFVRNRMNFAENR
jgi:hypothetical protein